MDNDTQQQRFKERMKSVQERTGETLALIINRRDGEAPDQLIYRLASAFDEALYTKLVEANKNGNLVKAIKSEPRLKFVADKIDD